MLFEKEEMTVGFYSHLRLEKYKRKVDMGTTIIPTYTYNIFGVCRPSCISQGPQHLDGWINVEGQAYCELRSKTGFQPPLPTFIWPNKVHRKNWRA